MPVAALSLAKTSAGVPAGLSTMLAAAASQSTFATEMRGLFNSWAAAAPAKSSARPTRMTRFNPLPSLCPVSQGLTSGLEVKGIEPRHTRAAFRCRVRRNVQPACPRREMNGNDGARSQSDSGLERGSRTRVDRKWRYRASASDACHHRLRPCARSCERGHPPRGHYPDGLRASGRRSFLQVY